MDRKIKEKVLHYVDQLPIKQKGKVYLFIKKLYEEEQTESATIKKDQQQKE